MSNINNHRANIKGKIATIFAGTMLLITGSLLPASARINSTDISPMPNPLHNHLNRWLRAEANDTIAQLHYQDFTGGARSNVVHTNNFRIDVQGQTGQGDQNIQLQLNAPRTRMRRGGTTLATVIVPQQYLQDSGRNQNSNMYRRAEVERNVRAALLRSLNDQERDRPRIYRLIGTPSNAVVEPRFDRERK